MPKNAAPSSSTYRIFSYPHCLIQLPMQKLPFGIVKMLLLTILTLYTKKSIKNIFFGKIQVTAAVMEPSLALT